MKRTLVIFAVGVSTGLAIAWAHGTYQRWAVWVDAQYGPREVHHP